ncbi:MAG: iron ABC transporter permease [Planctomycetes bacterium]|nr:iron ABC transporter permease [Planctomycetota bacterium]
MKRYYAPFAAGVVIFICCLPLLSMFYNSITADGTIDLSAYREILSESRQQTLFLRSIFVALGATVLASIFGVVIGFTIVKLKGMISAVMEALVIIPLVIPSVVIAMGWVFVLGQEGIVKNIFGFTVNIFTPVGSAFILSLCYFPFVVVLTVQGLRSVSPTIVKSAELSGTRWQVFWFILRPILTPYIMTGAFLVFLFSLSDYGVPSVLMVNVYPVEIFTQLSAYYDVKKAVAFCLPLMTVVAAVYILKLLTVRAQSFETVGVVAKSDEQTKKAPYLLVIAALLILGASVFVPIVQLIVTAGSFSNYGNAIKTAGDQIVVSIWVSVLGTLLMLVMGVILSLAYKSLGKLSRIWCDIILFLTLIIPGSVIGLGIIFLYTKNVWPVESLYPSAWIVAYGSAVKYIALIVFVLMAEFSSLRSGIFRSAEISGASRIQIFWKITLPLVAPSIIIAGGLAFMLSMGELSASVLINPPGYMTIPVRIASLLHFGEDSIVASLCIILCALIFWMFLLLALLLRRFVRVRLGV